MDDLSAHLQQAHLPNGPVCRSFLLLVGLRTFQYRVQVLEERKKGKGIPPMANNPKQSHWCSCNQLSYPRTALSTANKALHRPPLHPPLLSFNHPTTQLHITIESPTTFYADSSTHRSICLLKSLSPFPPSR